ncbi:MAG: hypothetical protein LBH55_00575 [Mycoplasmataceae bacterium]|jgi:sensor c-di-GMP phosphodiesterase-like protein|nr:hypothetical protein [Mycoplasmataceae bacterium]
MILSTILKISLASANTFAPVLSSDEQTTSQSSIIKKIEIVDHNHHSALQEPISQEHTDFPLHNLFYIGFLAVPATGAAMAYFLYINKKFNKLKKKLHTAN